MKSLPFVQVMLQEVSQMLAAGQEVPAEVQLQFAGATICDMARLNEDTVASARKNYGMMAARVLAPRAKATVSLGSCVVFWEDAPCLDCLGGDCMRCMGSGDVVICSGVVETCNVCDGSGQCATCDGTNKGIEGGIWVLWDRAAQTIEPFPDAKGAVVSSACRERDRNLARRLPLEVFAAEKARVRALPVTPFLKGGQSHAA
jgi:hypothetical protein